MQIIVLLNLKQSIDEQQGAFDRILVILREAFLRPSHHQQLGGAWGFKHNVLSHLHNVMVIVDQSQPQIEVSLAFAEFLVGVGTDIVDRGFTSESKFFLEKAEEALDCLRLPLEDNLRRKIMAVRGICTDAVGISTRAEGFALRQKCLNAIEEDSIDTPLGARSMPQAILLYNARTDFAYSLQHLNQLQRLKKICHSNLSILTLHGEEDDLPREYAKHFNQLAYISLLDGDKGKAVEYAERAYRLTAQHMPNEPITTRFRFCWATMLFQIGSKENAIEEHKAILQLRVQEYGSSNLLALQSQVHLGIMHYLVGDNSQAE